MPTGIPIVGEVWETTDPTGRRLRGVLSDITPHIITLVSFTGNRFRIAPLRLMTTWVFSQSPPPTALRCTRQGCSQPGILRYQTGTQPEWRCPRHLPVGVNARLTTESLGAPRPEPPLPPPNGERAVSCRCGNPDPSEDARVQLPPGVHLWICHRCSERWCLITDFGAPSNVDHNQRMFDLLNDVRVALSVENYYIQEITTTPQTYRVFEAATFQGATPAQRENLRDITGDVVVYAGLPIRNPAGFVQEMPRDTLLNLRLGGGPEHRLLPPERPDPTFPPPTNGSVGVAMQIGDQSTPIQTTLGPSERVLIERPENVDFINGNFSFPPVTLESSGDELLDTMNISAFISKGSRWVNRGSGQIVEVSHMGRATDSGDPVVHFKPISDDHAANTVALQPDFEALYRPLVPETTGRDEPIIEILKDEEWEHVETGDTVVIEAVDTKRNLITVVAKDRRRSVRMIDFVNNKWRKIVRRTAFARVLDLDDD
jgi:hypothetical protein